MKLSTMILPFAKACGLKKSVALVAAAGFDAIDFTAASEEYASDFHTPDFYRDIRSFAGDLGVYFNQAHAPFPSSEPDPGRTDAICASIRMAMRSASLLGARSIVVHPRLHVDGAPLDADFPERLFEENMRFYRSLIPSCEEYGIRIAIENMRRYPAPVFYSPCSTPEELRRYLDGLDSEWIVSCIDVGHAALSGQTPGAMIHAAGSRLQALHIQDMDGVSDVHTLPYHGILDWEAVMKALAEVRYPFELTFEAFNFFARIPEELWPDALKYMERMGRHLIRRFEAYAAALA